MFGRKQRIHITPEFMIVGLGNPGPEYTNTRHNIGFDVIEALAETHKIKLDQSKHKARLGLGTIHGIPVVLVKPLTYMNLSGQSVVPMLRGYGLKPEHLLIIADDMDLPLGKIRLKAKGGSGGHNGHKSISQLLGTQDYPRLRLGIGRPAESDVIDHVLNKFMPEDRSDVLAMIKSATQAIEKWLADGIEKAMMSVNQNPGAED